MTYRKIGAAALGMVICTGATAETSAGRMADRYVGTIATSATITHQAQLISKAANTTWVPTTYVMVGVAHTIEHQAQLVSASARTDWSAATYAAKVISPNVTLPLQHQAQMTALITQYEWKISAANLNN